MTRRLVTAFLAAILLFGGMVSVRASGGPYNLNPTVCHNTTPLDILWWLNECWYPDDPDWGKVQ